jgi:predicted amidohydrolase
VRVAAIQHDIVWEDRDQTLARLGPQVAQAAATGARLVSVTEMFATGFSMRTHHTAESPEGPTATWMVAQAAEHGLWLAGSVPLLAEDPSAQGAAGLPTNSLLVVGPDGTRHRYDKAHPFSYAGEHERFRPGTSSVVIDLEGVHVGLSVCYDLRFADLYWDRDDEVDLELVVANWPDGRRHHWRALLDARAIEGQVYVMGVNRVGSGGKLDYAGDSRIVDPMGEVLASGAGGETILVAEVDPAVVAATRERFPFRADRTYAPPTHT